MEQYQDAAAEKVKKYSPKSFTFENVPSLESKLDVKPIYQPVPKQISTSPKSIIHHGAVSPTTVSQAGSPPLTGVWAEALAAFENKAAAALQLENAARGNIYKLQFKHVFRNCAVSPNFHGKIPIGSFVIIECEHRTVACGVVVGMWTAEEFATHKLVSGVSKDTEENNVGMILRMATQQERSQLPLKKTQEEAALVVILHLAREVYKLPMVVTGAEYQVDGRKLSVYFTADVRVDIRGLVRELHNIFKTRIWMKKTNECTPFAPKSYATAALLTGLDTYNV
eukprot:gene31352-38728_t